MGRVAGLRSVAAEPFIIIARARSASFYDHALSVCAAAGFAPRIVQEANELFTVLSLVGAGLGVSLVPRSAALMQLPGVRFRELTLAEAAWDIAVAWHRDARRRAARAAVCRDGHEPRAPARSGRVSRSPGGRAADAASDGGPAAGSSQQHARPAGSGTGTDEPRRVHSIAQQRQERRAADRGREPVDHRRPGKLPRHDGHERE